MREPGIATAAASAASPPAAVHDRRAAPDIGRRARLELVFSTHKGRTVLSHGYAEPPLRLGRGFERGAGLHFILASSAPGLFGGDTIEQVIRVEPGAVVSLASQSALQVHPSSARVSACVSSRYEVLTGGSLSCWWDPLIPFAHSMLDQSVAIDIAAGARVTWSDAVMSGRWGRGERWAFSRLSHELRLSCDRWLLYLERYCLEPGVVSGLSRDTTFHRAGGTHYVGTMFRTGYGDDAGRMEAVQRAVGGAADVAAAADLFAENDVLLVRLAATAGAPFHKARQAALAAFNVVELS